MTAVCHERENNAFFLRWMYRVFKNSGVYICFPLGLIFLVIQCFYLKKKYGAKTACCVIGDGSIMIRENSVVASITE